VDGVTDGLPGACRGSAGAPDPHGQGAGLEGPRLGAGEGAGAGLSGAVCGLARIPDRGDALRFTIPGAAVGKGRPRVGRVGGFARLYTPEKTVNYEGLVKYAAHEAMAGRALMLDAVSVCLEIYCAVPASWSRKRTAQALSGAIRPTTKPDIDNVAKAVFDAMNGIVWKYDVQVASARIEKHYAETPRVFVQVQEIA
jgi:Holliday junction resolvase RusA-like endonuclease